MGYTNRKEIPEKYKWNLSDIYATEQLWEEAFNKVQDTGSNRDFGTTKAARMYFSMSEPSPAGSGLDHIKGKAPAFR